MSIKMLIEVNRQEQISIEEHCLNAGLTVSQYLVGLHNKFQIQKNGNEIIEEEEEKPSTTKYKQVENPKRKKYHMENK